jgi:hypothetical protein
MSDSSRSCWAASSRWAHSTLPPPLAVPAPDVATSLIVEPDSQPIGVPVVVPADEFATRRAWQVVPNVVGIARASARLRIPTPEGREFAFAAKRFDALEGIDLDDEGNLIVDEDPRNISFNWSGTSGSNHVFLVVRRGNMHALVYGPDVRLTVSDEGTGAHWYRDLDPRRVDRGVCANDRLGEIAKRFGWHPKNVPTEKPAAAATRAGERKHTARIRLLIYYTQAALGRYGGNVTTLNQAVDGLMLQLRDSLANTGRTSYISVELAAAPAPIGAYNEQPLPPNPPIQDPRFRFGAHLQALRERDDGSPDPISREALSGDIAILLVNDVGNPSSDPALNDPVYGLAITQRAGCFGAQNCGLAPNAFRAWAYGVLSVNTAVQNLTFSHEFGHLMGGVHDLNAEFDQNDVLPGAYPDSFGHRTPGVGRDIMADPECIDDDGIASTPKQCLFRYPQFSNPNANFSPFLVSAGVSGQADVARTLRLRAEPTGNIFPIGESQSAPDLFWDGFEF